jgi:hypothetical protein
MGEFNDLERADIELSAELRSLREAQERGEEANSKAHKELVHSNGLMAKTISTLVASVNDLVGDRKARNIMYTVALVILSGVGGSIAWAISYVDSVDTHVQEVEQEEKSNAKYGFELANGLRRDVDRNKKDIDDLQGHHTQAKPGTHIYPKRRPTTGPPQKSE